MDASEYWRECIEAAADECGATLTPAQIAHIADTVQGSHENYGLAFYQHPQEIRRLEKAERETVHCEECNGRGRITIQGPYHSSNSQRWKCHGAGKRAP